MEKKTERPWAKKPLGHINHPVESFPGYFQLPSEKKAAIKAAADALKASGVDPYVPGGIVRNMIDSITEEISREKDQSLALERAKLEAELAPLKAEQESLQLRLSELERRIEPLERALSALSPRREVPDTPHRNVLKPAVEGVPQYALQGQKSWDEKIRKAFEGRTVMDRKDIVTGLRRYSAMQEKGLQIEVSRAIARGTLIKVGEGLSLKA